MNQRCIFKKNGQLTPSAAMVFVLWTISYNSYAYVQKNLATTIHCNGQRELFLKSKS